MKIHVQVDTDVDLADALRYVLSVVECGYVSGIGTARGCQHTYHTGFRSAVGRVHVSCVKNRSGSETFHVYREVTRDREEE